VEPDEALARLRARGFSDADAQRLFAHFSEAEARGKLGHGFSRVEWLETLEVDPSAEPETLEAEGSFERWHGRGALGYLVLDAVVRTQLADPPDERPLGPHSASIAHVRLPGARLPAE